MEPIIIVHGGAGAWDLESSRFREALVACETAAAAGQAILQQGGSALDAVEAAARILEDAPPLDAGRGSYLNAVGDIEMDALIMDGRNLDVGAVGAVRLIQNPISLARRVMTDSEHALLVGSGAEQFAESVGIPRCTLEDLLGGDEIAAYAAWQQEKAQELTADGPAGDTIGAVALDKAGNLAVAVSTGGTRRKLPGRVGDSPLPGSGGYADNQSGAVSATGHGESLLRVLISKQVCDFITAGLSAQKACEAALHVLEDRVNGSGGLIAVDGRGRAGVAYNTTAMPHAIARADGAVTVRH